MLVLDIVATEDAAEAERRHFADWWLAMGDRFLNVCEGGGHAPSEMRARMSVSAKARGTSAAQLAGLDKGRRERFGSKNSNAKLTEADAVEIRRLRAAGATLDALAERFGVAVGTIHPILQGRTWRHVGGTPIVGVDKRRGESNHLTNLTGAQVVEIRQRHTGGETLKSLAAAFGCTAEGISAVVRGVTWRHVGGPIRAAQQRPHLTDGDVAEIRELAGQGIPQAVLAKQFGVSTTQ